MKVQRTKNTYHLYFLKESKTVSYFNMLENPHALEKAKTPSILDLILTNEENMVEKIDYQPSLGKSDHVVLSFNFNCFIEKVLSTQKGQLQQGRL